MECFRNYVGLKGCGLPASLSGFDINSLAGISLPMLEGVSNEEQQNFYGVWTDIVNRSLLRMESDILNALRPKTRIPKIHAVETIGMFNQPLTPLSTVGKLAGIYFELIYSEYLALFLEDITVYSNAVQPITLRLIDVSSGQDLAIITASLVVGYNTIPINREFVNTPGNNRYFLAYDTSVTNLSKTDAQRNYPYSSDLECSHNCAFDIRYGYPNVWGAYVPSTSPVNVNTIQRTAETFGLATRYQVQCSLAAYVCRIRERFKQAYAYLLGYELIIECIVSTRLNQWTVINRDEIGKLADDYERKFEKALKTALDGCDFPHDDCFECDPRVYTTFLGV